LYGTVPLSRRNILSDRRRLVISVLGVAVSIGLILLLEGLWGGLRLQVAAYEENVGANLFVGEKGAQNFLGEVSVLKASAADEIRRQPGVRAAWPINTRFIVITFHERKQAAILVGSMPGGMGGPWKIAKGAPVKADDEVVIDRALAQQHGIKLGDKFDILGRGFRVVGLSEGTRSWMLGYIFVSFDASARLYRSVGTASFILVNTKDPKTTAKMVKNVLGLEPLAPDTIARNDRRLFAGVIGGPLNLMVIIAFAAGTLIIALAVYSMAVERLREYGVVKAIGATEGRLFRVMLGQTTTLAALGVVVGFVFYLAASALISYALPQFWSRISPAVVVGVLLAAGLMGLLAAFLPARRVWRLDPASVYRG
jgi:putative ABC transport system permease protein